MAAGHLTRRVIWLAFLCLSFFVKNTSSQRKISEEAQIFQELRDGVFTVFGDEGHGSGFLIDSSGLILTNQHVIANSNHIKVQVNDSTIVPAVVLLESSKKDVAILRINSEFVVALPVLHSRHDTVDFAMEGERVLAIGSPLNQIRIVTSGIISKVESEVIISDININHGNSGGPLINLDKEVIGITTFGDLPGGGGPGVSGIIRIDQCFTLIDSAKVLATSSPSPVAEKLPVMPKGLYPLTALEQIPLDKKFESKPYLLKKGGYNIEILTPPFNYWRNKQYEMRLAKNRQKRESKGKAEKTEVYNPREDLKEWYQYVGEYKPVVIVNIIPKIGETKGSFWGNLLGAMGAATSGNVYYGSHKMEFKGDLKDIALYRDSVPVKEIQRGMVFVPLDFFGADWGGSYSGQDLARAGIFFFQYETFQPVASVWPEIKMEITSIDKPGRPDILVLPQKTIERVWRDFEAYRESLVAEGTAEKQ